MYRVFWISESGVPEECSCSTDQERDDKVSDLEARSIPCDWEPVQ